jgi:Protein of unknown function (DUF2723)
VIPRQKLPLTILIVMVALTRWVFRSRYLYDLDSVNFALAMKRFDPHVHQPHPPGYFLYICLGRLFNIALHDANLTLVVISILASCAALVAIYSLTSEWFGPSAAKFAGVLFLFSPLTWFHGTVALTYIVEAFFSGLIGYLCWRIVAGNQRFAVPAAVVLGLSAGIRPSSLLFLAPLFLFSLRRTTPRQKFSGLAALAATLTAWFVPMIAAAGGLKVYFNALTFLWQTIPAKENAWNSSPATSIARACTIVFIYFLCFGVASLAPLIPMVRSIPVDRQKRNFTIVWVLPALFFFTFGYLKFVNSGYLLLLIAPACLWLGLWLSEWYQTFAWPRSLKLTIIGASVVFNSLIFLASPFYCSYRQVRRFEAGLDRAKETIAKLGSPQDTLILGVDSHFDGFRHAGYYLPDYLTVEYPEIRLREGPRVFTMYQRDTQLVAHLPDGPYRRFIFFPLPDGDAYRDYMHKVTDKLPAQNLHRDIIDGKEYVTGSASDLPLLFPDTVSAPRQGVYVPLH